MEQLEKCQKGEITPMELESARQYLLSGLRTVHDSPGSIEGYYATAALSGLSMTLEEYRHQVATVDPEKSVLFQFRFIIPQIVANHISLLGRADENILVLGFR